MGSLYAKDVVDTALEWIGYEAEGSNHKYTLFSADLDECDYWNGMGAKNGVADWCSIFVNWCIWKNTRNGDGDIDPDKWDAHYFTFEPDSGNNLAAGCGYAADYYMSEDAWTDNPERGDQVFFRNYAHTGLVVDWDETGFYTVEGNVNGGRVEKRYYKYGDPCVDGFGRPRYDGWELGSEKEPDKPKEDSKPKPASDTVEILMPVLKKDCDDNGTVLTIQALLREFGFNDADGDTIPIDGVFGERTEEAVKSYQEARGLNITGIVDKETWDRILK